MASGLCAALTGRTHGCTDQPANVKKSLANSEHKADIPRCLPICPLSGGFCCKTRPLFAGGLAVSFCSSACPALPLWELGHRRFGTNA